MKFLLRAALLFAAAVSFAHAAPSQLNSEQARHLLLRTGFAPTAAEVQSITGQPADRAVHALIEAAKRSQPRHVLPPETFAPVAMPVPGQGLTAEQRKATLREQADEVRKIDDWWMLEMIETPTPLAERMALFWHGHFATSAQKVHRAHAMWAQLQLFHAFGLGSFREMLHAVARDPAMLVWLDGARSR